MKKLYDDLYAEDGPYLERKKVKFEYALTYHERKCLCVGTTGGMTIETVKGYVENQKGK